MPRAVEPPPGGRWHRLTVRDLPVDGDEPFTVVVPELEAGWPPVPVDAAAGRVRFAPLAGLGGSVRCFAGDRAAVRGAVGRWLSGLSPCQRDGGGGCGPQGHPLVVWIDARDGDAVERSLVVLGLQLLAGVTASQSAPLARAVALEWLGSTEGWVMVIEGDEGPEVARWLLGRFGHGTFAFSVGRLPQWPAFYSRFAIDVTDVTGVSDAGEEGGHLTALGMGTAADFGENASMIGLYSSVATEGGEPEDCAAVADRMWAAGDYPRALRVQRLAGEAAGGADGERARLENNLGCLYAALLRPKEAIAVLEACRDRLAGPGGGGVPEVLDVNLGLCYLQLADLTGRDDEDLVAAGALEALLPGVKLGLENAGVINDALRSLEDSARRARHAVADRMKGKAVAVFDALVQRHAPDAESPTACFLRDCLAFCGVVGSYGLPPWWDDGLVRAKRLFEENRIWQGMSSGESAAVTLRSRIRLATLAGLASNDASALDDAMAELRQVLEIAEATSGVVVAQCLLALSHLAMEGEEREEDIAPYAVRFAECCLRALGPEHPWSGYAAAHLELIRVQAPSSRPGLSAPYAPSLRVWEGPYAATPVGRPQHYPMVVPYLLAGDLLGAASRCYEVAATAAQREAAADFDAELRATIERLCGRELDDIQRSEAGVDLSWLKAWLPEALSRDSELLQLACPGVTPP